MTADALPTVGVVVVNYFREDLTIRCLTSLERLTWPASRLSVVVVDNGSPAGFVDELRSRFPAVQVVANGANLGFGGACNRGFDALGHCDHVALLNNDAVPEPDWLEPLVEALESDPRLGAATPKVLLAGRFLTVELSSPTARWGRGDDRALGVQLCGAHVDDLDVTDEIVLVDGFWGWEHDAVTVGGPFAWTSGRAVARLPVEGSGLPTTVHLRLASGRGPVECEVRVGGAPAGVSVGVHPAWTSMPAGPITEIVNNAGTVLLPGGAIADRGYLDPDGPEFDESVDVFGWSGAAVLIRRRFLDEVGVFDEPFFLYYEDGDLSWRGRLRGWSYRYVPTSVVHHDHSATVGDRSALAKHLAARNRLLMLTKCAPAATAWAAVWDALKQLSAAAYRDLLRKPLAFERPVVRHVAADGRVIAAFVRAVPKALRGRWRSRRGAEVDRCDAELRCWIHSPAGTSAPRRDA